MTKLNLSRWKILMLTIKGHVKILKYTGNWWSLTHNITMIDI
jgi:hypothetical protein